MYRTSLILLLLMLHLSPCKAQNPYVVIDDSLPTVPDIMEQMGIAQVSYSGHPHDPNANDTAIVIHNKKARYLINKYSEINTTGWIYDNRGFHNVTDSFLFYNRSLFYYRMACPTI